MKLRLLLQSCIFLVILVVIGYAENQYNIEGLNMTISTPAEWMVFGRDFSSVADSNSDIDVEKLQQLFIERNIYLNSVPQDFKHEIIVTMTESEDTRYIFDYNEYDAQSMGATVEREKDNIGDGIKLVNSSIYQGEQARFLIFDIKQENVYSRIYQTIFNGQLINITMHSYEGELGSEYNDLLKVAVDSIVFTNILVNPNVTSKPIEESSKPKENQEALVLGNETKSKRGFGDIAIKAAMEQIGLSLGIGIPIAVFILIKNVHSSKSRKTINKEESDINSEE